MSDESAVLSVLQRINDQLEEINQKLGQQVECPHGASGVCMPCIREMDIGWHIGQAVKS